MEAEGLSTFLTNVSTVMTSVVSWTGSCGDMITSTPMLFVPCVLSLGLIGISIIKRFC